MGQAKQKMIRQFGQSLRYSDAELSLIKNTFAENDDLLFAIRKVFLQFDLDKREQELVGTLSEEALAIIKKELIPEIDPDAPLLQSIDMWASIDFKNQTEDKIIRELQARQIIVDYLNQRFEVLSGDADDAIIELKSLVPNKENIKCETDWFQMIASLSARNTIILHIDLHLNFLKILAGMKNETLEQTKARLAKDSNK